MILVIYKLIYSTLKMVIIVLAKLLKDKKLNEWVKLRSARTAFPAELKNCIWFHASSGEIEYCKPLIRKIKTQHPNKKIVVSYSSPSALKLFTNINEHVDLFFPLPWDQSTPIKKLIAAIQPEMIVFAKTDFWPVLIQEALKLKTPLVAIAVYEKSISLLKNIFYASTLYKFSYIATMNESSAEKIKPFNKNVFILGDPRFDQALFRLNQNSKIQINSSAPIITFGSTWPKDDIVLIKAVDALLHYGYKIIWCPHEYAQFNVNLDAYKTKHLSQTSPQSIHLDQIDILIVDQVGYLADIYRYSTVSFVGGSFVAKVHSVLEPLCAKNIVCFGPHHLNNREAVDIQNENIGFCINNESDLIALIKNISSTQEAIKLKIETYVQQQIGSADRIVSVLMTLH